MSRRLTILIALLSAAASASAVEVAALFGTATMPGKPADHIVFSEIQIDKEYDIEGVCRLVVKKVNTRNTFVNKSFLHWYKSDVMTVTPAEGVTVSEIRFNCTEATYCVLPKVSTGAVSVDAAELTVTWRGEGSAPFTIEAAAGQLRVPYMGISYRMVTTGVEERLHDDVDAPVEYYNMQGVRIAEPIPGQICLRCQGNRVEKIIVR